MPEIPKQPRATDSTSHAPPYGNDPRELRAAREVVNKLQIALKTYHLFPPYNVNVQSTIAALEARLHAFFREFQHPLALDTASADLFYRGTLVYSAPSRDKSFSYRMAANGVVRIVFETGINRRELMQLMDVFQNSEQAGDLEDDFVTLLWEKGCRHIEVVVRDDGLDQVLVPSLPNRRQVSLRTASALRTGTVATQIAAVAKGQQRLAGQLAATTLDEAEAAQLQARAEEEAGAAPVLHLVDVLLDLYEEDQRWETFEDVLRLIGTTLHRLVERRQFTAARTLSEKLEAAGARPQLADERHRAAIEATWMGLGEGAAIETVVALLEDTRASVSDDLFGYLATLRPNAVEPLFRVFQNDRHCEGLATVLARLGGLSRLSRFATALRDPDPRVVAHTASLLLQIDVARGLRHLLELADHAEPAVRLVALRALTEHGDEPQVLLGLPLISDSDSEVRKMALRMLARRPIRAAFGPLWQLYENRAQHGLDRREEELALEAAALADPELAANIFPNVLTRRSWLKPRRAALETQQRGVVRALARVPHPRVRAALLELAKGPEGFVQQLCSAALATPGELDEGDEGDEGDDE